MAYTKQGPFNNGGAPSLSAARLTAMDQGISDAHDALSSLGRGVALDSFPGSTDDAKLTAAMSSEAAQTYPRPILLGPRAYTFNQARTLYDGFALIGMEGMSNAELSSAGTSKTRVTTSVGSTWLSANGGARSGSQQWDVTIRNIAFTGSSSTQWLGGSAVIWCMNLKDLSFTGYKSILGSQATKLLLNLCLFDGWLSFNNSYNGAIHIGGSDNNLFMGMTNIDSGTAYVSAGGSNGQYHLWLDGLEKTQIGPIYLTAEGGWNGIRVSGTAYNTTSSNLGGPNWIHGAKVEGRNSGAPCNGSLIRVEGGSLVLTDSWLGYAMASPSTPGHSPQDAGVVHQTAGNVALRGCTYDRAGGVAETVPLLYQAGGVATLKDTYVGAKGGTWSGLPRYTGSNVRADDSVTAI